MVQLLLKSQAELMLLAAVLVLLYSFRYTIGTAPTYLAAGLYFVFALFAGTNRLLPPLEGGEVLGLHSGLLWLPFLPRPPQSTEAPTALTVQASWWAARLRGAAQT